MKSFLLPSAVLGTSFPPFLELTRGCVGRGLSSPLGRPCQHCNFIHLAAPYGRNSPCIVRNSPRIVRPLGSGVNPNQEQLVLTYGRNCHPCSCGNTRAVQSSTMPHYRHCAVKAWQVLGYSRHTCYISSEVAVQLVVQKKTKVE